MSTIDAHAHIFPNKIAAKASYNIGEFYGLPMRYDGTADTLLAAGKRAGVERFVVCSVAMSPEQVSSINNFIAEAAAAHPEFIGFAALHQDMRDIESELARAQTLGLRGVKLHPDFQRFSLSSPGAERLFCAIEGKMPLILHAGDKRFDYSSPRHIAAMLDKHPGLDIICAHFGGYCEWDDAINYLAGRRIWVDTSSSLAFMPPEQALRLIDAFGSDNIVFGTDYPMWDASDELELIERLKLPDDVLEKILFKNICSLLNIL